MGKCQILLTNDDGIHSPGLWAAAEALEELGFVTVAAPREQSSGMGRSLPIPRMGSSGPRSCVWAVGSDRLCGGWKPGPGGLARHPGDHASAARSGSLRINYGEMWPPVLPFPGRSARRWRLLPTVSPAWQSPWRPEGSTTFHIPRKSISRSLPFRGAFCPPAAGEEISAGCRFAQSGCAYQCHRIHALAGHTGGPPTLLRAGRSAPESMDGAGRSGL